MAQDYNKHWQFIQ